MKIFFFIINILIGLIFFCPYTCLSQIKIPADSTKSFYKESGIIFTKEYNIGFDIADMNFRYTPTISDLLGAEKIFLKKYNETMVADKRVINKFKPIKNVNLKFSKYARQYLGYLDSKGQKNILIQFLNFAIPDEEKKRHFKNFEKEFIVGSGHFFGVNTIMFVVNIDSNSMKLF